MKYTYKYPHYAVTADVVVFTIKAGSLQVLLIKRGLPPFKGRWALPGGFLRPDEDIDTCARRELQEEAGIGGHYLEQLYSFGASHRDPRERVISVAYFALIRSDQVALEASSDAASAAWARMDALPALAFDHRQIVATAYERLVAKLEYTTIAFQFLPERFTMRELLSIYETVLGKTLDRRNFYKKMLSSGELVETSETRIEGPQRPATVYRLRNPDKVRVTK